MDNILDMAIDFVVEMAGEILSIWSGKSKRRSILLGICGVVVLACVSVILLLIGRYVAGGVLAAFGCLSVWLILRAVRKK